MSKPVCAPALVATAGSGFCCVGAGVSSRGSWTVAGGMTEENGVLDGAGAASMRRNTSGAPADGPAGNSGRAAGIMGMPAVCGESAVRDSGAAGEPFPANGNVLPVALAAGALRTSIGAVSIPRDTALDAGATLAVS